MRAFLHSHSYTGNPLACTAALATLDIFATEPVLERNTAIAARMGASAAGFTDHPHVGEVRQTGMIMAIEMVADRSGRRPFPWQERRGLKVYRHALANGVLLRPIGNVVYFMPPYVITDDELDLLARTAFDGIETACA
jgi:adenosylmethionine-8-amino-7-oxononanoate aminotransferase